MKLTREQKGWVMFDCANSAYYLIINSTIFPVVFTALVPDGSLAFGIHVKSSEAMYQLALGLAYLIIVFLSPILSGIADYGNRKKFFMKLFTFIGSAACFSLYFFNENRAELGVIAAAVAMIGFSGSIVFYNAFLPEVAAPEDQDRISARGFATGYFGSSILLILIVIASEFYEELGFSGKLEIFSLGFVSVAAWWMLFSQYTFKRLPLEENIKVPYKEAIKNGFKETKKVWQQIRTQKLLHKFIITYFFISMGLQTLMLIAPMFALNDLKVEKSALIVVALIIQVAGILGALFFARLSKKIGNFSALLYPLIIFVLICLSVVFINATLFYVVGVCLGFAMAGAQSLARSTYSKILPETHDHASFFSFYDIAEKMATALGMLMAALVSFLGNSRSSILLLSLIFAVAIVMLKWTQKIAKTNGTKI
ncbi:MAG: MFS transporter [Flavobacteriales bacterium]